VKCWLGICYIGFKKHPAAGVIPVGRIILYGGEILLKQRRRNPSETEEKKSF